MLTNGHKGESTCEGKVEHFQGIEGSVESPLRQHISELLSKKGDDLGASMRTRVESTAKLEDKGVLPKLSFDGERLATNEINRGRSDAPYRAGDNIFINKGRGDSPAPRAGDNIFINRGRGDNGAHLWDVRPSLDSRKQ